MKNKKINVLLSGIAGFIGSNLALELTNLGYSIVGIDDFSTGNINNLKGVEGKMIKCDITGKLPDFGVKFDFIFHQAAITDPRHENKSEIISKNVSGMKNMVELAKKHNAKLIYASSASVYGNGPSPMKEDQELNPLCEYAESKIKCEKLALRNTSLKSVGLRYFNVFGSNECYKGRPASMIFHIINLCAVGKTIKLFKYGEQVRDQVYVKDVVNANILAMKENVPTGIYNVGGGIGTSFDAIAHKIRDYFDNKSRIEYVDNPYDAYQTNTIADLKHSMDKLGYEPHYNFVDGLDDYMRGLWWK